MFRGRLPQRTRIETPSEAMSGEEEERPVSALKKGGKHDEVRGVEGRVSEMKVKFDARSSPGHNPEDAERRRREAQSAKGQAARYNMVLRGQQMMAEKKQRAASLQPHGVVVFEPYEFTEEWEDYPWHLAAAFTDEDDAFWMPELALALEKQDEDEINRAVLRFFLEEMDPDRVDDLDQLLKQFEGQEELLFLDLHNTYGGGGEAPPAAEADRGRSASMGGRRASFVVSGVKYDDGGWAMNNSEEGLVEKMKESGAAPEELDAVVKVAEAGVDPFEEKANGQ